VACSLPLNPSVYTLLCVLDVSSVRLCGMSAIKINVDYYYYDMTYLRVEVEPAQRVDCRRVLGNVISDKLLNPITK